jgi:hypothetical protein
MQYDPERFVILDDEGHRVFPQSEAGFKLIQEAALKVKFEKATHRCALFMRNENDMNKAHVKTLLQDCGAFWVTEKNVVYLKTSPKAHYNPRLSDSVMFFTMPVVDNGKVIPRPPFETDKDIINNIFSYGQLYWEIKPYMEGEVPRAYTREEMTRMFINQARTLVKYWDEVDLKSARTDETEQRQRLSGLLFSLFSMMDGSTVGMPGFILVPCVAEEDVAFHREQGDNWWPHWTGTVPDDLTLQYPLHELLSSIENEERKSRSKT